MRLRSAVAGYLNSTPQLSPSVFFVALLWVSGWHCLSKFSWCAHAIREQALSAVSRLCSVCVFSRPGGSWAQQFHQSWRGSALRGTRSQRNPSPWDSWPSLSFLFLSQCSRRILRAMAWLVLRTVWLLLVRTFLSILHPRVQFVHFCSSRIFKSTPWPLIHTLLCHFCTF